MVYGEAHAALRESAFARRRSFSLSTVDLRDLQQNDRRLSCCGGLPSSVTVSTRIMAHVKHNAMVREDAHPPSVVQEKSLLNDAKILKSTAVALSGTATNPLEELVRICHILYRFREVFPDVRKRYRIQSSSQRDSRYQAEPHSLFRWVARW